MRTAMRKGQAVGHGLGHPGVQPPVGPRSLHPFGVAVRDRSVTGYRSFVGQSFPMGSVGDHRCAGSSAPAHYWADVHAPPAVIV